MLARFVRFRRRRLARGFGAAGLEPGNVRRKPLGDEMEDIKRRVFISWSGTPSRMVASALREWLPQILQNTIPFMSEHDIAKGSRGQDEIAAQLRDAALGIVCLTPGNLGAPWILFEAGALSNSLAERELVCPYLIGLRKQDVAPPLSLFQLASADRADTLSLIKDINNTFEAEYRLSEAALDRQFDKWWPELEVELERALEAVDAEDTPKPEREPDDLLAEVLETVRRLEREWDHSRPIKQEELPLGPTPDESSGLSEGDTVRHPKFGEGVVAALSGRGRDLKAVIDFESLGKKKVVVRYANLQLVD